MRERLGGELWWAQNLAVSGVGGVQMSFLGHMGWSYGKISGGAGGSFQSISNLLWKMVPR